MTIVSDNLFGFNINYGIEAFMEKEGPFPEAFGGQGEDPTAPTTVDNTQAIQDCLDFAANLVGTGDNGRRALTRLQSGLAYGCTGQLTLRSGTGFDGGGSGPRVEPGRAELRLVTGDLDDGDFFLVNEAVAGMSCTLQGLKIKADSIYNQNGGVSLNDVFGVTVRNCSISQWGIEGLDIFGGGCNIEDNQIQGLGNAAYAYGGNRNRGAFTIGGADNFICFNECAGSGGATVHDTRLYLAAFRSKSLVSVFVGNIFEASEVGQAGIGGGVYIGNRWDTNAAHGLKGLSAASEEIDGSATFTGCYWGGNSSDSAGTYDHIYNPADGFAYCTFVSPTFYNGGGLGGQVGYWINDSRNNGDVLSNAYLYAFGEQGQGANGGRFLAQNASIVHRNSAWTQRNGATPNVALASLINLQNTTATTITDFVEGNENQMISVVGDGYSTVNAGTNFFLGTGVSSLLLEFGCIYRFLKSPPGIYTDQWLLVSKT